MFAGEVKTAPSEVVQVLVSKTLDGKSSLAFQQFDALMKMADQFRTLDIRTNADTPDQVANAVAFGAQGVGLTRTEHMFFEGDRIDAMREMILAEDEKSRRAALAKLLPYQKADFAGIFRELKGYAGDDPFPRPAPARVPAARQGGSRKTSPRRLGVDAKKIAQKVA